MKTLSDRNDRGRTGRALIAALGVFTLFGIAANSASADDDRNRRYDDHRDREVHRGPRPRIHEEYRAYDNGGGYVYAPPAVVYAPAPPSGIDFVFPIEIR
jgi:hypothetical protein